ncbi:MAG: GNAT family N-acetyltransferase [Christensenellaceae bacterium]|jgi:RimJ/RimL family protein N-acetyltransferase|nr:GNAT family N-acetyltransferase [Christensenellaceae bacterium]
MQEGDLTLRRAAEGDARALFDLRYLAYLGRYARVSDENDPCLQPFSLFKAQIEGGGHFALVLGKTLVGGAEIAALEDCVEIKELYVAPEAQGQGLGAGALRLTEMQFPSARYRVTLPGARDGGLFHRLGYRPEGEGEKKGERYCPTLWQKEKHRQSEIVLSALARENLPRVAAWISDLSEEELFAFTGGAVGRRMDAVQAAALYAGNLRGGPPRSLDFAIEVADLRAVIGVISLTNIEWDVKRCQVSRLFVQKAWRGVGIGRQAVAGLCELAIREYGFRGFSAILLEESQAALHCLSGAGFTAAYRSEGAFVAKDGSEKTRILLVRGGLPHAEA